MTTEQDFYVKEINNNDHLYTTIFDSLSGDPFRVKFESLDYYLSKKKRQAKVVNEQVVFHGEWIPSFVKTKEETIGSPSSSEAKQIASVGQSKAGKRRRGKRGKRK